MTDRLYYRDPDVLEFEAMIASVYQREAKVGTVLDRSAFYPTSGGQLHDIGQLNGVAVIDVEEDENGQVVHVTESTVGEVGQTVWGAVDVERRWRHRQQHTAQHILSALCANLLKAETVSVHLGESYGAVELDVSAVSDQDLTRLEAEANRVVREALPVEILLLSPEEAEQLPLRKPPAREGTIRIIKTGELDWSACGGTHCRITAQVGLIKLAGTEKLRGHCVVRFLAGSQALADYAARWDALEAMSQRLTCHFSDLPDKTLKLQDELKSLSRKAAELQKQLLPVEADRLAGRVHSHSGLPLVSEVLTDTGPDIAGSLAAAVAERIGGVALLLAESRLVLAVDSGKGWHAGKLAKALCAATGLRGGGGETAAQFGGAEAARMDEYRAVLEGILTDDSKL